MLAKAPRLLRCLGCVFCSGFEGFALRRVHKKRHVVDILAPLRGCVERLEVRAGPLHEKPG